jgi:4'-phosphopantetheinyl transferase
MAASTHRKWTPGPAQPLLADGAVHVWRADLNQVGAELAELLCSKERQRAARFLNQRHSELWGRSRALLRQLLGRYLQRNPTELRFLAGEHGKPALASHSSLTVEFNMSHSAQLALYAFSRASAVGVDVETARRPIDELAIAARVLGTSEAERLQALDPATRRREFLRAWTQYEAKLKCLGLGIGGDLRASGEGPEPWVADLELAGGAAGAVAATCAPRELRCWGWQPG